MLPKRVKAAVQSASHRLRQRFREALRVVIAEAVNSARKSIMKSDSFSTCFKRLVGDGRGPADLGKNIRPIAVTASA